VSDRFVRKVRRITMDWTVEVQSLLDRERRRLDKEARRLRRSDPELAERLRAAIADSAVDDAEWPNQAVRLLAVLRDAGAKGLGNPALRDEVLRTVDRGARRVETLDPPPEDASWHVAVVAAQRSYETALRQFYDASSPSDVSAAADRVEQARRAINESIASGA
jgi:hypothetical protein